MAEHPWPAEIELREARACIDAMHASKTPEELDRHWKQFIGCHHRVWEKLKAQFKKQRYWNKVYSKFVERRRADAAALYIHHARHAREHRIEPLTHKVRPIRISGGADAIVSRGGELLIMNPSPGFEVSFSPTTAAAAPVIARDGRVHYPPTAGFLQPPVTLTEIAEHGMIFFFDMFGELEQEIARDEADSAQ